MLPKLHKPPKLKPLALGDIFVALINQQHSIDHTQQYKKLLGKRWITLSQQINIQQQQLILPQFAQQQYTHQQILDYQIKNNIKNTQEYQHLLAKVDRKINSNIHSYGNKLQEGEQSIGELMATLSNTCTLIQQNRTYLQQSLTKINKNYSKVAITLRKITNISKVIQILSVWGQSKIPYLFSIDIIHPLKYQYQINNILQLFHNAIQKLQSNPALKQSLSLKKILASLKEKEFGVVRNVYMQFRNSIIAYTTQQEYKIKYEQYISITSKISTIQSKVVIPQSSQMTPLSQLYNNNNNPNIPINTNNNILTIDGIKQLIKQNSKQIFTNILHKHTTSSTSLTSSSIDLLNQSIYLQFYDQLIQQYVIYFRSWHYITTFHLDNNTGYGHLFLENRKYVFIVLSQVIKNSIENSKKFIALEYKIKLELIQKLYDYMEAGQKWMGYYQNENKQLSKIIITKLNTQLNNIFGLYNNLIKNILAQQITVTALENVDQSKPLYKTKIRMNQDGINYMKIRKFLSSNTSSISSINGNNNINGNGNINNNNGNGSINNGNLYGNGYIKQQNDPIQTLYKKLPQPPQIRMKIGQIFIQMISQYLQRSKYLQQNKSIYLNKIYQHFQFILFMIYQVCLRQSIKNKLFINIQQQLNNNQTQVSEQTSAISLKQLNELCKINIFKRKYLQITQFINNCGNKYDGIKIAGIIDVNKLYDNNNHDLIFGYIKILVRVIGDLKRILDWLTQLLPQTPLKSYKQSIKIYKLSTTLKQLFSLILQNNMQNISKKYLQSIPPIMLKLKWQIKKFNQQTSAQYKQYKIKILQIFRNNTLFTLIKIQILQYIDIVINRQIQNLYRILLQCYGRIQKINDNGRQIIRLDCIQITKILNQIGIYCQIWGNWFDKYLDLTAQRSYKIVLDKIQKIGIMYQFVCWKYSLLWIVNDMSSKEKKQYNAGLARIYMQYLTSR